MSQSSDKVSYKPTLNLPQTDFAMEAKLTASEPPRLERWRQMKLYQKLMEARAQSPKWILHDGPPFANGDIHIGHLINKTLKDVFMRFKSMRGFQTPYVPGWDCHGLPIEHKIQQELGPKMRQMEVVEIRRHCYQYAEKYATLQNQQFQRLGILGDWEHPYWTMSGSYEAATLEVFARFVERGLVYKKLKPVPWSIANQTALADAELEYQDVEDNSIFVRFGLVDPAAGRAVFGLTEDVPLDLLVWTTTPWTLPANLAVAVHPQVRYVAAVYSQNGVKRAGIVAEKLCATVLEGVEVHSVSQAVDGEALLVAAMVYHHPFLDRQGRVLPALYVTTEDGTGLVHTAPGHGEDDYLTGLANGLEVYCPVLHNGTFDQTTAPWLAGVNVWKANPLIIERLRQDGLLLAEKKIRHSYPHDWRGKSPIIFRATEQWFIAVDKPFATQAQSGGGQTLRARAQAALESEVAFVPGWGRSRMGGMLQSRPDWCISRQRAWGLPIPVFYNQQGQALLTGATVRAVAEKFREHGSEAFFTLSAQQLLEGVETGADFAKEQLRKETDIFDVWFESGSSWHAVLQQRPELAFPADLYLEGSDQHRGWFQLSLLPSLGYSGKAPFKTVLTHGFVVKPDGTKVSKSDKEYVTAIAEINRHGADLLRLWCCSVDYQGDIPTSPKTIQEFSDKYRKIRNTLRYLLSNLYDFNPATNSRPTEPASLDGWISAEMDQLISEVTAAYESYNLHRAFRLLHDFCAVQLSSIYGNAMKDRLYCEKADGALRRRCQTVMHRLVIDLTKLLAPMLIFTADEAWEHIAHKPEAEAILPSVHLALLPAAGAEAVAPQTRQDWKVLMKLREQALGELDKLKKSAGVNKSVDTELVYHIADEPLRGRLEAYGADLEDLAGAGYHSFAENAEGAEPSVRVIDRRGDWQACARSWKRRPDVGADAAHPDLCRRDAAALAGLKA